MLWALCWQREQGNAAVQQKLKEKDRALVEAQATAEQARKEVKTARAAAAVAQAQASSQQTGKVRLRQSGNGRLGSVLSCGCIISPV